jgi:hypothetical protein
LVIAAILAAAAAALTPPQLFDSAFERLQSYPVPAYAIWIDTWKTHAEASIPGVNAPGNTEFAMRYAVRLSDGVENGTPFPVLGSTLPDALIAPQFQGPFAWSVRTVRAPQPGRGSLLPDIPEPLKTIAHVVTSGPPSYAIDDLGAEDVDGHRTQHLSLRPLSSPQRHNLRDLWIDPETFDIWKAHFVGTYRPDPMATESSSDVTVFFKPIASYWILSRMMWTWTDSRDSLSFTFDATTDFIGFPPTLPDWLFDERAYQKQRDARTADFLAPYFKL